MYVSMEPDIFTFFFVCLLFSLDDDMPPKSTGLAYVGLLQLRLGGPA